MTTEKSIVPSIAGLVAKDFTTHLGISPVAPAEGAPLVNAVESKVSEGTAELAAVSNGDSSIATV